MDTVRADHLSCYGYHRETTPNLDAFAASARLYKNALSPSCYTLPSHASFFTGLSLSAHGTDWLHRYLDERIGTLAEQLQAAGYQTVAVSANSAFVCPHVGLHRGFQTFWNPEVIKYKIAPELLAMGDRATIATAMHNRLAKWFADEFDPKKPFFLFLNYCEAHQPYAPPSELLEFTSANTWKKWQSQHWSHQFVVSYDHMLTGSNVLSSEDIAELQSLYDDTIRYVDMKIGDLLKYFKSTGLDDNTAVLITSDHGEHFDEHHLMSHQYSLYEPLVRALLLARFRDRFARGEEDDLVQSHDVYPTILELAGLDWKPTPGQNCQSLLQSPLKSRYGISEFLDSELAPLERVSSTYPKANLSRFARRLRAIQREKTKLICPSDGELELYDLTRDPAETRNLAQDKPEVVRELAVALDSWLQSFDHYATQPLPPDAPRPTASPEWQKALRGLGYAE
jgi:arylsulfatase A-like enzyme